MALDAAKLISYRFILAVLDLVTNCWNGYLLGLSFIVRRMNSYGRWAERTLPGVGFGDTSWVCRLPVKFVCLCP